MGHERLAIMGLSKGEQPISHKDEVLCVNGEIYNYNDMEYSEGESDCFSIFLFKEKYGMDFLKHLRGMFAFALYDRKNNEVIVARDPVGIIPLYYGYYDGHLMISSELKCLDKRCQTLKCFPPGHYMKFNMTTWAGYKNGQVPISYCDDKHWFAMTKPTFVYTPKDHTEDMICKVIRDKLIETVEKHMMSEVPYGLLLSGGLDSSLTASIAQRIAKRKGISLQSFCVGLKESADLVASRKVADFIGTEHHEFNFTVEEGLMFMQDIIYHIETYDYTIRSSTPMYFMAKRIASMNVKFVLSGEGADEIFGGYLYFHKAPNAEEFHNETQRKLKRLHLFDCLRANKVMMAWGIEARVPFLDSEFLKLIMDEIDPLFKMTDYNTKNKIEKYILRKAFDCPEDPYLPDEVLWRQKEQFQDGVGYSWVDGLKEFTNRQVSDWDYQMRNLTYEYNTPHTKEDFYFRKLFEKMYPNPCSMKTVMYHKSVACSTEEAIKWDSSFDVNESSGRGVSFHNDKYNKE